MWNWGSDEQDDKKGDPNKTKLREENAALKAEIARLRAKAATSPATPSPSKEEPARRKAASPPSADATSPVETTVTHNIKAGDFLMVSGLTRKPELNGRLARVVAHDPLRGTWSALIEGETKRFALKPANLVAPPKGAANYQPASLFPQTSTKPKTERRKKAMTSRSLPSKGLLGSPGEASVGSPSSPTPAVWNGWSFQSVNDKDQESLSQRSKSVLSTTEREEVRQRLYSPLARSPPKPKVATTARVTEADIFDSTASADGVPVALDERPPFDVPHGKRRTHTPVARAGRTERTNREKPRTARGSPTTWALVNKQSWEGRTASPTGRFHQSPKRRADVRGADLHSSINYFATTRSEQIASTGDNVYTAPDNDQKMKEASFLTSQAWFESLRHYPSGKDAMDSQLAYSGYTHGGQGPSEHLETDVRTRMGLAAADPAWRPQQLQEAWAPEPPALANRLASLRSKLRGVPVDSEEIAVAGSENGPALWA